MISRGCVISIIIYFCNVLMSEGFEQIKVSGTHIQFINRILEVYANLK